MSAPRRGARAASHLSTSDTDNPKGVPRIPQFRKSGIVLFAYGHMTLSQQDHLPRGYNLARSQPSKVDARRCGLGGPGD